MLSDLHRQAEVARDPDRPSRVRVAGVPGRITAAIWERVRFFFSCRFVAGKCCMKFSEIANRLRKILITFDGGWQSNEMGVSAALRVIASLENRRLLCAFAVLFWSIGLPRAPGQTLHSPVLLLRPQSTEELPQRRKAIRKNKRFLGWKVARQSHQDTSKWVRQKSGQQILTADMSIQKARRSSRSSAVSGLRKNRFA